MQLDRQAVMRFYLDLYELVGNWLTSQHFLWGSLERNNGFISILDDSRFGCRVPCAEFVSFVTASIDLNELLLAVRRIYIAH